MGYGEIFTGKHIYDFINAHRKNLQNEINAQEIDFRADLVGIKQVYFERYHIPIFELAEPRKINAFNPYDSNGARRDTSRAEVTIEIPYRGKRMLFDVQPNPHIPVYFDYGFHIKPIDSTHGTIVTVIDSEFDKQLFESRLDKFVKGIKKNFPAMNAHLEAWNNGLLNEIEGILEAKKASSDRLNAFMEEIGLEINELSEDLIPPAEPKQFSTEIIEIGAPVAKIPVLKEEIYDDILNVLLRCGISFERRPSLHKGKDEEALRDMFLLFLETRYKYTSGHGEALNGGGKTDILLEYTPDHSNIFIAECKVWKGKGSLNKAIKQLLGYLTHRDTKTALIFFVYQANISRVVETAKREMLAHPNFKAEFGETATRSFSYEFCFSGDPAARFRLQLMFFHFR